MTLIWVGLDYYKRKTRIFMRDSAEGKKLTAEFFSDEAWHNIPAYTHNFHYIMEKALIRIYDTDGLAD